MLVHSSYSGFVIFLGLIGLLFGLSKAWKWEKKPFYEKIIYLDKQWFLCPFQKKAEEYSKARISFECGLFMLIQFREGDKKRHLILFFDQIPSECKRVLRLLIRYK